MEEGHSAAIKDAPSKFEQMVSVSSTEVGNLVRFKIVSIKQLSRDCVILTAEMNRVGILGVNVLLILTASASSMVERGGVLWMVVPSERTLKDFVLGMVEGLSVRILAV
ncbi:hypothetical protein P3T76_015192 [Phytophthora citrophthora]|uniref:Uncharacterized protein n=1 Tax=Phytophthora citrophthora TaxID=4793 RepID=A0AAD9LAE9_9STRA|nr:hypothetical protein P3T76_015192 [Phytophthora citrophthora]